MMDDMTITIPLSLFLELTEYKEKLRVIRDFTNEQKYSIDREDLAILGGFELKVWENEDADM